MLGGWNGVQPAEQRWSAGSALPPAHYDAKRLGTLRRGGPNGLVTVLLGLFWWSSLGLEVPSWRAAVMDFRQCVAAMMTDVN